MISALDAVISAQRPAPIYLEGTLPIAEANTAKELGLKDNQIVQASLESRGGEFFLHFSNSAISLQIARDIYASWRLPKDGPIQFRVQIQADGSIVLHPLAGKPGLDAVTDPALASADSDVPGIFPDRFAQLYFRPQTLSALQNLLQPGVLEGLARQTGQWPTELQEWLKGRPALGQLSGEQLRAWILQSGWLNEALMAQGRPMAANDLKSALRSLLKSLRHSEDGGSKRVEDALDDIESGQLLESLASRQTDAIAGMVLAFQDAPPIRMQIRKDELKGQNPATGFVVDIEMQTPDWGTVWLKTRVSDSNKVELTMWTLHGELVELARSGSAALQSHLEKAGLNMLSIQIIRGSAPMPHAGQIEPLNSGQLLDIRT
jgi:hypothetical protein